MSLKLKIDTHALASQFKEMALEIEQDLQKGVAGLAAMTHAHVMEQVNRQLHSTRQKFMDSLGFEEISSGVWVVSVNENGLFIEEGIENGKDMKPDLLKKSTKVSKDGHRYRSIPFDMGKPSSQSSGYSQNLIARIKYNLKKEGIPYKSIEKHPNGAPKLGRLHTFNWGGEKPGKANTPVLKGVNIYQSLTKSGNIRRDILTFRTVSDSDASVNKWIYPGLTGKKFLDEAMTWAENEWSTKILPDILNKYE